MSLSIIIVNYKSTPLVLDCLAMIDQDPSAPDFEIIVVDNASGGDPRTPILTAFPRVTWIQMEYNSGFARANNEGIRRSTGETVLLLNSDTLPAAGMIAACYQGLLQSEYVAAGVQLSNSDGTPQISGNYFMKGGLNYLLPLPYMGKAIKWMGERMKVKKPHVPDGAVAGSVIEVDWINGAFLMVKKSAIDTAGLMDEDFFLYAEEAEWCGRLRKTGKLCLFGALTVIHLQGETANQEFGSAGKGYYNLYDRKGLQIMLSNFVRIRKQFGTGWFLVQLFFYLLEIPVFFTGVLLSALFARKQDRYSFTQFINYCKNTGLLLGKSAVIIRNKPYFYKVL
ncbi:MAG TPA: glycosyltransferase family 2 protein [Puia sp.]|nr:glycosyltransferase family 2 protein [Puia sp.]